MPKPLTPEQIAAIRAVPLGTMPNKVRIVLAMTGSQQTDIVSESGLTPAQVSNAATGKGVTTVDTARAIAKFFDCEIELLFPDADDQGAAGEGAERGERRGGERRGKAVA